MFLQGYLYTIAYALSRKIFMAGNICLFRPALICTILQKPLAIASRLATIVPVRSHDETQSPGCEGLWILGYIIPL